MSNDLEALQAELDRIRPAAQAVVEFRTKDGIRTDGLCDRVDNLAAVLKGDKT
jgi:hypothetical protein